MLDVRITATDGRLDTQHALSLCSSVVWTRWMTYRHSVLKNVGIQVMLMIPPVDATHRWHFIFFFFEFRAAHGKELFYRSNYFNVPTKTLSLEELHHESVAEHDEHLKDIKG